MGRFNVMAAVASAVAAARVLPPGAAHAATTRDARAASPSGSAGATVSLDSFFSGVVSPGASRHWIWTNAGSNIAYRVASRRPVPAPRRRAGSR